ncbi:DUF3630 family protein [Ferrimonas balearica]|uniref:DUF3630 family protein n=1 Tax=Ferrimonas balearica TaxID=44012 RepID=UPI001C99C418|nr:DUF3630 family protein [Ferrimonas balearica]MBY5922695.1 DUF3630 family protein [Ferrimonas balearica]MBY5995679.1 DUF3630 family protein [Ferrimonas balearica]
MESTDHPLLFKLGQPQFSTERQQLLWHCPLSQEETESLAPLLMARLECQLGPVELGADRLFWPVTFEDTPLSLQYEALCETLWLQPGETAEEGAEVVAFIAAQVRAEHV